MTNQERITQVHKLVTGTIKTFSLTENMNVRGCTAALVTAHSIDEADQALYSLDDAVQEAYADGEITAEESAEIQDRLVGFEDLLLDS